MRADNQVRYKDSNNEMQAYAINHFDNFMAIVFCDHADHVTETYKPVLIWYVV